MNNDTDKRHLFSLLFPLLGNGWSHLILVFALSITGSSITSTGGLKTYINKNNQLPLFSLNRVERGIGWRKRADGSMFLIQTHIAFSLLSQFLQSLGTKLGTVTRAASSSNTKGAVNTLKIA